MAYREPDTFVTSFTITHGLRNRVHDHSKRTGAPFGEVVRRALISFLEQHEQKEAVTAAVE